MQINWFPGHMAKSVREIEEYLKVADCVIYVLDSRAVRSCFNPSFDSMINVPIVYLLNKCDTVPKECASGWVERLSRDGNIAAAVTGADNSCSKAIISAVKKVCAKRLEKQRTRGLFEHLRAVVIGVPNTGKSTVVNSLCGKARMNTGNRAGVTRAVAWARVDTTLDVLDTPGTLYPKISDRRVGENLAIIGSIKDEVLDASELSLALIERLNAIDTGILAARFGAEPVSANADGLEAIALARGFRIRGGELDTERAAKSVIDDFRKGRLGKIALEWANG